MKQKTLCLCTLQKCFYREKQYVVNTADISQLTVSALSFVRVYVELQLNNEDEKPKAKTHPGEINVCQGKNTFEVHVLIYSENRPQMNLSQNPSHCKMLTLLKDFIAFT